MTGDAAIAAAGAAAYAEKDMSPRASELFQVVARRSLVSRIFLANAAIFVAAYLVLVFAPVTISVPVTAGQLLGLTVGLVVLFVVDLIIVRHALARLHRLTAFSGQISTVNPGQRLVSEPGQDQEVRELTEGFNTMLDRLESERRESGRLALAAQERERRRVAHALHDEVGQALTAVTLLAQRAADGEGAEMRAALEEITETSQQSLEDVRRLARELRPEALDDLGLVNALIALARRIDQQSGIRVRHEFEAPAGLPEEVELALYRVAQESLTNVIRHSEASEARITLRPEDEAVVLQVADNGRGLTEGAEAGTAGIAGMRERAMLVGGELTVLPVPSGGTEVRFQAPRRVVAG
jgi:two-component system, NarL family, sensor histidine kinase UhpB